MTESHGGDKSARTPPVTIIEPARRRMRANPKEAVVVTTDGRGRIETQPCDLDLILKALDEHYRRRTH